MGNPGSLWSTREPGTLTLAIAHVPRQVLPELEVRGFSARSAENPDIGQDQHLARSRRYQGHGRMRTHPRQYFGTGGGEPHRVAVCQLQTRNPDHQRMAGNHRSGRICEAARRILHSEALGERDGRARGARRCRSPT